MIKIDKVKIEINDQKIELTIEEIRELHGVLDRLLGEQKLNIPNIPYIPCYPPYPYPYPGTGGNPDPNPWGPVIYTVTGSNQSWLTSSTHEKTA